METSKFLLLFQNLATFQSAAQDFRLWRGHQPRKGSLTVDMDPDLEPDPGKPDESATLLNMTVQPA